MAGEEAKLKKVRTRSPAYPYLALPEALERTGQLRRAEGRHAVSVAVAMQHWGYKAESSTGYSCIAALKKFGLVDEEGVGEDREVRLSALALTLLIEAPAGSAERTTALRTAALNPRIHAELWERYGPELPSDQTLRRFLLLEKNFNEASVDEFIAEYRATILYAGLSESQEPLPSPTGGLDGPPKRFSRAEGANSRPRTDEPSNGPTLPGLDPPVAIPAVPALLDADRVTKEPGETGARVPAPVAANTACPVPVAVVPPSRTLPEASPPLPAPMTEGNRMLPVPLDHDLVVQVPYPMSEESFELLIDTLQLWKKRLVRPPSA